MTLLLTITLIFGCVAKSTDTADATDTTNTTDTASAPPVTEPWLELGTGFAEFLPLEDGDELELVYGPQGGWHVDVTARFGDVELEGASLTYQATDPDDGALLNYVYEAELSALLLQEIDDGWVRLGDRVVFDIDSDDDILDRTVLIEVTFTDGAGVSLSTSHTIVVVGP